MTVGGAVVAMMMMMLMMMITITTRDVPGTQLLSVVFEMLPDGLG
jgi:hypothetical protein